MHAGHARDPGATPGSARYGLAVVCLGSLVGPLDSAVNIAFPAITDAFGLHPADIQWIVVAFIVAQAGPTLVFGRLGDLYGHRRVFRLGLAACVLAHLACALAPSYAALVGWRVAQGVAVGLAMACAPALATLLYPPETRRRVLALYLSALAGGLALGPLVGGLAVAALGWAGAFWLRVPIALAALVLAYWLPEPAIARTARPRLDVAGALLLTAALAAPIALFATAGSLHGTAPWVRVLVALVCLAASIGLARALVRHERRVEQPILDMRYFAQPAFARLQALAVAVNLACFAIMLLVPYALVWQYRLGAPVAGAVLACFPGGAMASAALVGRFARRVAARRLLAGGVAAVAAALAATGAALAWPGADGTGSLGALSVALLATGLGLGAFQVGYLDVTTATLPATQRGVAGSLLNVTRVVGFVLGAGAISWLHSALHEPLGDAGAQAATFAVLAVGVALAAIALRGWIARLG